MTYSHTGRVSYESCYKTYPKKLGLMQTEYMYTNAPSVHGLSGRAVDELKPKQNINQKNHLTLWKDRD